MSNRKFQVAEDSYATIQQRFLNWIIDMIVQMFFLIVFMFVSLIIGEALGSKKVFHFFQGLDKNPIGLYTLTFTLILVYYNFFEILFARTISKFVTGTLVVDEHGEKPHYERILIRSLCRLIPFDWLSVLISSGRGWHDSLSKTYVVDKKKLEENKRKFTRVDDDNN